MQALELDGQQALAPGQTQGASKRRFADPDFRSRPELDNVQEKSAKRAFFFGRRPRLLLFAIMMRNRVHVAHCESHRSS